MNTVNRGEPNMEENLSWLLQEDNPAINYRTRTEILGEDCKNDKAKNWIFSHIPNDWYQVKGMWYAYYITALAECGLTEEDIPASYLKRGLGEIEEKFNTECTDFLLLTAFVKLGFEENTIIQNAIAKASSLQLPDGGFLCQNRKAKFSYVPKSCYKANLHALRLCAECKKKGISVSFEGQLIQYFLHHNLFYRQSNSEQLILDTREGWRTIDVFFPFESQRMGIQNVIESLCALGYGNDSRLQEAWNLISTYRDEQGRIILGGTLTKSYLPKEKVGKPSKWATFYTVLAERERDLYI